MARSAHESLSTYREKRRFERTPEPAGEGAPRVAAAAGQTSGRFVVQRHRARRLHYDFRLEIGGVLVSWAVPKGLTLDPSVRHLAVHVEDHPVEYFDFEGVIPRGEYGGGDVIVWDHGTWSLDRDEDAAEALDDGELHLELSGSKLAGRFVLVRTGDKGDREQWLVLHKRDAHSVDGWDPEQHDRSVLSGRTNDEVAAAPEREWSSAGARELRADVPELAAPTPEELDELDALGRGGWWEIGGQRVKLSNLDKVLFPAGQGADPVTKRELVRYYATIAPVLLPHLAGRPLNLHRYPDGVDAKGFWQKQAPRHAPQWLTRWKNPDAGAGESREHLVADGIASLVWLANHAAVELHAWTSLAADPQHPTYALIDIDPGEETSWDDVITLARLHHVALGELHLEGFPKLSGRRGIQVWVPIAPGPSFDETRDWVQRLSTTIGRVVPDLVSWEWEKNERAGRARLDFTQNAVNKTLVAPYSVRAAPRAPVSVPIRWDELDDPDLRSDAFTVREVARRVGEVGDLMRPALSLRQSLAEFR